MNNSQNWDIFSDYENVTDEDSSTKADEESYQICLSKTKALLSDTACMSEKSIANIFITVLKDCKFCIAQSLYLVSTKLSDKSVSLDPLLAYIDNAVTILQMLSNFLKSVVESIPMSCHDMKTFPIVTGLIIIEVFSHCKNSETVYGVNLSNVERQLKDLFRTCHELQLTYLIVLEKHFIFDLSEQEELSIILEALNINLRIGEIVQALDVKTMAEQWKGFMAICERHSAFLMDLHVHQDCVKLLYSMILNDMKIALEGEEDDKVVVRSMKIANFCIKILMKMCNIFQHSAVKPSQHLVDLLLRIYLYNPSHLETVGGKSAQFINNMVVHVFNSADLLLAELVRDESFLNVMLNYNLHDIRKNDELLGFVILIVNTMKICVQNDKVNFVNSKLIFLLLSLLPDCFVWCNLGLSFKVSAQTQPVGLFEYLLVHCATAALSIHSKDMILLERWMYETLLGTDTFVALFAANLWVVLARTADNNQLVLDQLTYLCQVYQKLEEVGAFTYSPPKLHLTYTMSALFESLDVDNRAGIYSQFEPLATQNNMSLWSVLKIKNLPIEYQRNIEGDVVNKVKTELQNLRTGIQDDTMVNYFRSVKLAATCSLHALEDLEQVLIESWLIACPKSLRVASESIDVSSLWYFEYLESLVALTCAMKTVLCAKTSNIIKVLHVLSGITLLGNTELILLVVELLCALASYPIHDENHKHAANLITDAFRNIICCNFIVRNRLFAAVYKCKSKYLELMISSIVNGDTSLMKTWQLFDPSSGNTNYDTLKELLSKIANYNFSHKCISNRDENETLSGKKKNSCSSNFDLADLDTLFDPESDSEPASKKIKLDTEVDDLLTRIESDVTSLRKINSDVFTDEHKRRIRVLRDKLVDLAT